MLRVGIGHAFSEMYEPINILQKVCGKIRIWFRNEAVPIALG